MTRPRASLAWAESHAGAPALKSLIQLRVAQVELARGNGAAALATLDLIPANSYQGLAQELRGDVLVKLGRSDDARKAYEDGLVDVERGSAATRRLADETR